MKPRQPRKSQFSACQFEKMLLLGLGFHSGRKQAHASGKSLAGELLQQCVMGIDNSIPDAAQIFDKSEIRVNFAVTNVKVKLRGTLV